MKLLLLFLFSPIAMFGQSRNAGHSIDGPFANRPVCSRNLSSPSTYNGDIHGNTNNVNPYECLEGRLEIIRGETTGPADLPNPSVFNANESEVGSNASIDIRAHGAYMTLSSTTCSTKSGSARVTLGSASNFRDGEYATCYNTGPSPTVALPSVPTITPVVHDGGMTVTRYTGSTSYAYCIVAEDRSNGRSSCSSPGSTSTGAVILGKVGATLSGCTRANQIVTCSGTSLPFLPGMQIWIAGAADTTFNGNWITISPTNTTTITFLSGWDTRNGAATSTVFTSTVLTYNAWGWFMNRVSWTEVRNAFRYHIYGGPNCPTTCNWMGQTVLNYWDDYGSRMGANQTRPPYIPSTAPSSAANQHFTFQIMSGGGTTTLIASANAGATRKESTLVSDIGPAIVAAATAATAPTTGTISNILVPNVGVNWQVNSYTELANKNVNLIIDGPNILFNNTVNNPASIVGILGGTGELSFGWSEFPLVGGTGYPLISGTGAPVLKNLLIRPSASNGGLAIYLNTPVNLDWDHIELGSSPGSTMDCEGQAVLINNTATGFFWNINTFTFQGGACEVEGKQYTGDSPVPFFTSTSPLVGSSEAGSGIYMKQGWFVNRGGVNLDYPSTACIGQNTVTLERAWEQNNTVPAVSWSGPCSHVSSTIQLTDIFPADFATPTFVNYGNITGVVIARNVSSPAGGMSSFTGNPINGVSMQNLNAATAGMNSQSFNQVSGAILDGVYAPVGGPQALTQMNEHFALGAGYSLFTNTIPPAAPTCSVAAAGPPYTPAGIWQFRYGAAFPPNAGVGPLSGYSPSCMANGTSQQITIMIPAAIPGAIGYTIWRGFDSMLTCSSPTTSTLSYVWTNAACGPTAPQFSGGGPAGISRGNVNAASLVLGATIAPEGTTNTVKFYMDSTANWPAFKPSGNRAYVIPGISGSIINGHNLCADGTNGSYVDCLTTQTVTSGTVMLEMSAIAARTCSTVVSTLATGVTSTDTISYSFNAAPPGNYNMGLFIQSYVTPGKVNFLVCNPTPDSLTPPTATLNWRVTR